MAGTGKEDESSNEQWSSNIPGSHDRTPCTRKGNGSTRVISLASLDDLGDSMLIEVLQRLPTAKSAVSCKPVSKRLCSLISSDYFIRCFISHHAGKNLAAANADDVHSFNSSLGTFPNTSAIILGLNPQNTKLTIFYESLFDSWGINVNFLSDRKESVSVLASYNDLLLCCVFGGAMYVCNPFTRQYVALPPAPELGFHLYGLVNEPFYSLEGGECSVHHEYRLRVVQARSVDSKTVALDIYSSEKNEWTESVLSVADYCKASNAVPYNGKLHWFNGENVFAFDPFDAQKSCVLDGSQFRFKRRRDIDHGRHCLGVCRGRLRIMQLLHRSEHTLTVWELKNYATWDWRLEHKVNLKDILSRNLVLHSFISAGDLYALEAVGFNTSDGDVVYLESKPLVFSCNLRVRKLEFVAENSVWNRRYDSRHFFPIILPLWPTPPPTLQ